MCVNLLGRGVAVASGRLVDGLNEMGIYAMTNNGLHHGQMLQVVVRLEQGVAGKELDEDAPNTPDIARKRPPETENDFGGTVMPRRDDRGVVLVLERSRAKVDETDFRVKQDTPLCSLSVDGGG